MKTTGKGNSMEPAQWLADYQDRLERAAYRARAASASLREVGASVTSARGEVTVTVNAAGLLDDVTFTPAARRLEVEALGRLVVDTAREAQRLAGARMTEVMTGYLGEGAALAEITSHLPAEVRR